MCSFTVRKDQSKKSGDAKDEMCEKNNAQQSVTKTPRETESREEVRMFEVSTDSLKKQNIPDI